MPSKPAVDTLTTRCPKDWQVLPLAEVAYFQEGPGILAKDFREAGVPLLRLKCVEGDFVTLDGCNFLDPEMVRQRWRHFRVDAGDLLISTSASLGRVSVVTEQSAGGIPYTGLIRFKSNDKRLLPKYLKAFLGSAAFIEQAESMASGSVIRHFGPSHIRQMAILLPPLDQQAQIGDLASLLDDRLRLLRETNESLESIAQALFKSWFIDFDPVRAKADGRELEGMDAATAALFPSELKESALGLIPKGWAVSRLGDIVELVYGKALKSTDRRPGRIPVYGSGGIIGYHDRGLVGESSVIVGRKGTVGALYWEDRPFFPIDTTFYVKPRTAPLTFCYYAMQRLGLENMNTDAAVPGLNRENAYRLELVRPADAVLNEFDILVRSLRNGLRANAQRAETLTELRDSLLPRLISGKLRLPEAVAQIEDAIA